MASPQPPPRPRQPTRDAALSPPAAALRLSSERYLRGHPETRLLLRGFLSSELLHQRPDDVLEFAAGYFTQPELPRRIREQLGGPGAAS